jgi:hypothetical protein
MSFSRFVLRFRMTLPGAVVPLLLAGCVVAPCPSGLVCGVAVGTGGASGTGGKDNPPVDGGGSGGATSDGGSGNEAGGATGGGGKMGGNGGKGGSGGGGNAGTPGSGGAMPTGKWDPAAGNLIGMDSECGNMSAVAAKPDEDMIVAGVALHGLWASRDGGDTYEQLGTGKGSDPIVNRASWFIFDPDHTNTFWESGIYNSGGVYRTDDDGVTLNAVGDVRHNDFFSIDLKDPDRNTIVAGGHEGPQIMWLTTDAGKAWVSIGQGLPADDISCVFPLVLGPETYLVGCGAYGSAKDAIYRTEDAGKSWNQISHEGGAWGGMIAKDGSIYWARAKDAGMTRSIDGGMTFETVSGMNTVISATPIELPDGRIAALGAQAIMVSGDQGKTWAPVTAQMPYRPIGLTYSAQRKAFYIWHFTCLLPGDVVPVPPDAILKHDFDYEK